MAEYPKRDKLFAVKHFRRMVKSTAAQDIGPTAMLLVGVVSSQEDAKRYTGPVTYFNEQLMPLIGVSGRSALVNARAKAVAAGWLHYEAGGKSKAGKYWAMTPPHAVGLDDSPTDETGAVEEAGAISRPESGRQTDDEPATMPFPVPNQDGKPADNQYVVPNQDGNGTANGLQRDGNGTANLHHSYPRPRPSPKEDTARAFETDESAEPGVSTDIDKPAATSRSYPAAFSTFWAEYPRKSGKRAAQPAFDRAVARVAAEQGVHANLAAEHITAKATEFAKSESGRAGQFCPHPTTWLNRGNYDDDQAEWNRGGRGSGGGGRDAGRYDPASADDDFAILADKLQDFTR